MKIILLLMAFTFIPRAGSSINPDRLVEPFLRVFEGKLKADGTVRVPTTSWDKEGNLFKGGPAKILEKAKFDTLHALAKPVFRMEPVASAGEEPRKGTAFHIGHNLVLTNEHVLDPERKNTTQCKDFRILDNDGKAFGCEKVIFCNNQHDICLIKMAPKKPCPLFCGNTTHEITESGAVKMRGTLAPAGNLDDQILTAIGNSMGLGIHVSQGRGVVLAPNQNESVVWFYAPVTKGNSGGPLIDSDGFMVGLIKQQSSVARNIVNPVGNTTYNIALRVETIIRLCREALATDRETLEQFNESVVE
jgi:S1-C subfamily serine protease